MSMDLSMFRTDLRGHRVSEQFLKSAFVLSSSTEVRLTSECEVCGEYLRVIVEGSVAKASSECAYPNGPQAFETHIEVPSGILVFGNDLRPAFPDAELAWDQKGKSINYFAGLKHLHEEMAQHGLLYTFVGNTCPSIYLDNGSLLIGRSASDSDGNVVAELPGWRLGWVCTDLWAVCAADLGRFQKRVDALELGPVEGLKAAWTLPDVGSVEQFPESVPCAKFAVRVVPGRYRVTHQYSAVDSYDYSKPCTYTRIDPAG